MWWYNIIGDNEGQISHLLRLDHITAGCDLLTFNLVSLKYGNSEPILTVKIFEWRKFIDYFGLSIEAYPFRVGKKNIYIYIYLYGYIPITSYGKLHI